MQFLNLRRACELGEPKGCTIFGAGLSQDPRVAGKRILKFLRKGCEGGDADGCYVLSKLQVLSRVPGGADSAFRNSYSACRMGQVQACTQTGLMFLQGVGCTQDVGKGLTVLVNTCNQLEHGTSCLKAAQVIANLADNGIHVNPGTGVHARTLPRQFARTGLHAHASGQGVAFMHDVRVRTQGTTKLPQRRRRRRCCARCCAKAVRSRTKTLARSSRTLRHSSRRRRRWQAGKRATKIDGG